MSMGRVNSGLARLVLPASEMKAPARIESLPTPSKPAVAVSTAEKVRPPPENCDSVPPTTVMSSMVKLEETGKSIEMVIEVVGFEPPRDDRTLVMIGVGLDLSIT
jgi:hypothetical protein